MKQLLAVQIGEQWFLKQGQKIGDQSATQFQSVGNLVSVILFNVYIAAGILLFILLLFGGISIILGAGSGDPKKTGQGQKAIVAALSGFLVIFASYWIIQLIAYVTGIQDLKTIFNTGV